MKTQKGRKGKVRTEAKPIGGVSPNCLTHTIQKQNAANNSEAELLLAIADHLETAAAIAERVQGKTDDEEMAGILESVKNGVRQPRLDILSQWYERRSEAVTNDTSKSTTTDQAAILPLAPTPGGDPYYQLYCKADEIYNQLEAVWPGFDADNDETEAFHACETAMCTAKDKLNRLSRSYVCQKNAIAVENYIADNLSKKNEGKKLEKPC